MSVETPPPIDPTRRGFLAGLLAGTALLSTSPALAIDAWLEETHLPGASRPLTNALHWIRPGVGVTGEWMIEACRLEGGAVVIDVGNPAGDSFRLDVCRRSPETTGVEVTEHFDLRLMNEGSGGDATGAEHHQPTRIIAEVIRRSESELTSAPRELSTHAQRLALFHAGDLRHPAPIA